MIQARSFPKKASSLSIKQPDTDDKVSSSIESKDAMNEMFDEYEQAQLKASEKPCSADSKMLTNDSGSGADNEPVSDTVSSVLNSLGVTDRLPRATESNTSSCVEDDNSQNLSSLNAEPRVWSLSAVLAENKSPKSQDFTCKSFTDSVHLSRPADGCTSELSKPCQSKGGKKLSVCKTRKSRHGSSKKRCEQSRLSVVDPLTSTHVSGGKYCTDVDMNRPTEFRPLDNSLCCEIPTVNTDMSETLTRSSSSPCRDSPTEDSRISSTESVQDSQGALNTSLPSSQDVSCVQATGDEATDSVRLRSKSRPTVYSDSTDQLLAKTQNRKDLTSMCSNVDMTSSSYFRAVDPASDTSEWEDRAALSF